MNNEHDKSRISLHDFRGLEGLSLRGFLNMKRREFISENAVFPDKLRGADNSLRIAPLQRAS
jgi:hypothetical protein